MKSKFPTETVCFLDDYNIKHNIFTGNVGLRQIGKGLSLLFTLDKNLQENCLLPDVATATNVEK